MTKATLPTTHLKDPLTGMTVNLDQRTCALHNDAGAKVAEFDSNNLLVRWDWSRLALPRDLADDVSAEANLWDTWAEDQPSRMVDRENGMTGLENWRKRFAKTEGVSNLVRKTQGAAETRMLDIGGTCKDSVHFLGENGLRLDQVEVSSASQRLGLNRLRSKHGDALTSERVRFHNIPAETLPFADEQFDLVFSRSTIHHVRRPGIFDEIHRVLKPGGNLLFVERYMSTGLLHATKAFRTLRNVDRGTDMPVTKEEINHIERRFRKTDWQPHNVLWPITYFSQSLERVAMVKKLDSKLSDFRPLSVMLGVKTWVLAQK